MSISKEAKAEYDRAYRAANRARIAEAKRAYVSANPDAEQARVKAWVAANRERSREIKRAWLERNPPAPKPRQVTPPDELKARNVARVVRWRAASPEKYAEQLARGGYKPRSPAQKARHASYQSLRCRKLQHACPPWADKQTITAIYLEAQRTGMHVDHDIPLQSKVVCGLHVPANLKLLPPAVNYRKRNHFQQEN